MGGVVVFARSPGACSNDNSSATATEPQMQLLTDMGGPPPFVRYLLFVQIGGEPWWKARSWWWGMFGAGAAMVVAMG